MLLGRAQLFLTNPRKLRIFMRANTESGQLVFLGRFILQSVTKHGHGTVSCLQGL